MANSKLCKFADLPPVAGMPHGCAWNHYHQGDQTEKDELGRLSLLTPEVVKRAARTQIQTGLRVQLDWGMHNVQFAGFGRKGFEQKIIAKDYGERWLGTDDEVSFNTQCSSQWDGFRHAAHVLSKNYYNGLTHDEIVNGSGKPRNGIDAWCDAGGIAGRAVLLDWLSWRRRTKPNMPDLSPVESSKIPLSDLKEVAAHQGVAFEAGDILLIRSGFVEWHNKASESERRTCTAEQANYIGVEATQEALEWFWDNHFAAVAGDTVAFESWPPVTSTSGGVCLHEWFLAMWGMPIGEMWDLETLAQLCKKEKRWTFFLTSSPLRVLGGIGSTPNVMAIF